MREEIFPKNILMIGPTGVGKTEIARRLAKLVQAPFVKVEATKFTEVGYVGRDVESIVRDLVENAVRMVRDEHESRVRTRAEVLAEDRLLNMIVYPPKKPSSNPFAALLAPHGNNEPSISDEEKDRLRSRKEQVREEMRRGEWEDKEIEIEVAEKAPELEVGGNAISLGDMMGGLMPQRTKQRRMKIKDARKILIQEEAEKLIDQDAVQEEAVRRAEQNGIIFLDEIDKIAGHGSGHGPDVSREGVQRDILPIVEGSTVNTKYGPVKTDFMLFIAAGAFHVAKISDLIPELQGRFPVHVNLKSLTREDFVNILVKPDNALTRQYAALLETDKVHLTFSEEALTDIAEAAFVANETGEAGGDEMPDVYLNITPDYVREHLSSFHTPLDTRKYIL